MTPVEEEIARFRQLQQQLPRIWDLAENNQLTEHTSVMVPSMSVDQEELAKIQGAPFYEERLLFSLIRLRHPRARMIYVTSQPIHPDIIDYYLHLLVGVPASHARRRLHLLCVYDASPKSLTEKLLERPRALARLKSWIGDPSQAYLTCFNSSLRERQLAVALGIPLNGLDPALLYLGTKSGSRRAFTEAGVDHPFGFEDLTGEEDILDALSEMKRRNPKLSRAVIKLNESFSGEGNALFRYPDSLPQEPPARRQALAESLRRVEWPGPPQSLERYLSKFSEMEGIVEEFAEAGESLSPSVQMRINPDRHLELISSHDQVLGGPTGQVYLGCRFPARAEYRCEIQREALKIGEVLRQHGVVSRFGIDFLVLRDQRGPWRCLAVEINLRMGGTTHPFLALEFLTGGRLDAESGEFLSPRGTRKYYFATDNLKSPSYRRLVPEDFMDILILNGLQFNPASETGVLFHMIGALSQYGKLGMTSIGNSRDEAEEFHRRTVEILDRETGAAEEVKGRSLSLFDEIIPGME